MNISDCLQQLGIPYITEGHHHCTDGFVQIDCPFCSKDSQHWRMGINSRYLYATCWTCGRHGLLESLAASSGQSIRAIKGFVCEVEGESGPAQEKPRPSGVLRLPAGRGPLLEPHRRYLKRRGFDPDEIVRLWGVEGIGPLGKYAWRLMIPIHLHGEIVSFTTRAISDKHGLRYRSAEPKDEKYLHKDLLYGEDYCRHALIVVEGPLDVWAIGPGAVCTFGPVTAAQRLRISKYAVRCLCMDNEPAAQAKARELMDELSVFPGETYNVTFSRGKDASRAPCDEVLELRRRILT